MIEFKYKFGKIITFQASEDFRIDSKVYSLLFTLNQGDSITYNIKINEKSLIDAIKSLSDQFMTYSVQTITYLMQGKKFTRKNKVFDSMHLTNQQMQQVCWSQKFVEI